MVENLCEVEIDALANVHTHLREGDVLGALVEKAIEGGADVLAPMPNTNQGLTSVAQVLAYNKIAKSFSPTGKPTTFLPIVMVNESTDFKTISACIYNGIFDCKVYPLDRTTKSHNGVRNYGRILPLIKYCGEVGMKCHFHPEHPSMMFDNRDAEFAFLPILDIFLNETEAIIVSEHGTDERCVPHWLEMAKSSRFFVTLTAHHLATDEDNVFGDVRSVCKPPIKTRADQASLIRLVQDNYRWVMAGLDDAPHDASSKHVGQGRCSCGAYTAPFGLQLYAHALDNLISTPEGVKTFINFTSRNARRLHNLPPASRKVKLIRKSFLIPLSYKIGSWIVEPFFASQKINWQIAD